MRSADSYRLSRVPRESGARLVTACGVMRVLFSTTAGTGHFGPLIPVARVCQAAGHTVAARAMAAEIAALPDVAECLPLLEQLASQRVSADE
jgi:hypothetical protein